MRQYAERSAINAPMQGTAADIIKRAMINVYRRLKREQLETKLLLQIHDELVFEVPPEEVKDLAAIVQAEMTGALAERVQVPLGVDMGAGKDWLELEEVS